MNEARVAGAASKARGKAHQAFGRMSRQAKSEANGIADQVKGSAEKLYGQAQDSASELADAGSEAARETFDSIEDALRTTIEQQPFTAMFIALGVGWLCGRMHRPI